VIWPHAWELVRELQFSRCEPLRAVAVRSWKLRHGDISGTRVREASAVRSRYQTTASGDCNRLRTLVCV
jgi:hypothetical protein